MNPHNLKYLINFTIPAGSTGPAGTGVSILGSYDTYDDLIASHPTGNTNDAYLVNGDLFVWSDTENAWKNVGHIQGPQGLPGPTGPTGPYKIDSAFFATFNQNYPQEGLEVFENERIPIDLLEVDQGNLCVLDTVNHTIQFNKKGAYKISFMVSAYVPFFNTDFDPNVDFVSIGFRKVDDAVIYAGNSQWIDNEMPHQITASGIFNVTDTTAEYELYNFSNRTIYLNSPDIRNISLHSYFLNSTVTIIIEYLGP